MFNTIIAKGQNKPNYFSKICRNNCGKVIYWNSDQRANFEVDTNPASYLS